MKKINQIMFDITHEFQEATKKFGSFHNAHEGYAVLLEEVDELWDAIKMKQTHPRRNEFIRSESIQVAAMAIRLLYDCCELAKE